MSFREIESLMILEEPTDKIRMFRTLLILEAEDSEIFHNEIIEIVLRVIGLYILSII
jgi:hypothetical protein